MVDRAGQDYASLQHRRGVGPLFVVALLFVAFVAGAATMLLLNVENWSSRRNNINTDVFADGIGIYLFNEGKYNLLVWKKRIVAAPGAVPDPKDIAEASQQAVLVGPGVRFFAYGLDFSKWPAVPPYVMAFCIVRNEKTIDGIYPVRIKPIDQARGPIYELLLPPEINDLKSGALPSLFWVLNFQYSCNDGWTFKFAHNR